MTPLNKISRWLTYEGVTIRESHLNAAFSMVNRVAQPGVKKVGLRHVKSSPPPRTPSFLLEPVRSYSGSKYTATALLAPCNPSEIVGRISECIESFCENQQFCVEIILGGYWSRFEKKIAEKEIREDSFLPSVPFLRSTLAIGRSGEPGRQSNRAMWYAVRYGAAALRVVASRRAHEMQCCQVSTAQRQQRPTHPLLYGIPRESSQVTKHRFNPEKNIHLFFWIFKLLAIIN